MNEIPSPKAAKLSSPIWRRDRPTPASSDERRVFTDLVVAAYCDEGRTNDFAAATKDKIKRDIRLVDFFIIPFKSVANEASRGDMVWPLLSMNDDASLRWWNTWSYSYVSARRLWKILGSFQKRVRATVASTVAKSVHNLINAFTPDGRPGWEIGLFSSD